MLKGVNKCIIELSNTKNKYFERVIFFVKPEYTHIKSDKLKAHACMYLDAMPEGGEFGKMIKKQGRLTKKVLFAAICGGIVLSALGLMIFLFLI